MKSHNLRNLKENVFMLTFFLNQNQDVCVAVPLPDTSYKNLEDCDIMFGRNTVYILQGFRRVFKSLKKSKI